MSGAVAGVEPVRSRIQTYSGRWFDFRSFAPGDFHLEDIAWALSMQCRYNGMTHRFYSVAEHSVIVSTHVAPAHARHALLHDAAEAYMGDIVSPLKQLMPEFTAIEARMESAIFERFGVAITTASAADVKFIDEAVYHDECWALLCDPRMSSPGPQLHTTIASLQPSQAREVFVSRFLKLFPEWRP